MRAVLFAIGSRGDTEPCVGLGARLHERGHDVVVVAPERYAESVTRAGLTHRALAVDPAEVMASPEGQALLSSGPVGFIRGLSTVAAPLAEQVLRDCADGARGADMILAPPVGGLGRHVADHTGAARVVLHFQPSAPTREFPNPLLGPRRLGPWINWASYAAVETAAEAVLHRITNRARREVLGLPALRRGATHLDRQDRVPTLCAVSESVQPRPADWPDYLQLTGAWEVPSTHALPAATAEFLAAGPAPVFLGFGSMVPADPPATATLVADAVERAGVRAIVQGLPITSTPELHVVEEIAHPVLFAQVAAVVHHGGAGTTAAGLRAGVPTLVCPFFGDQPYWGGRVDALGVGPTPIPIKQVTVESLAAAMREMVEDQPMIGRARRLGEQLRAEDGAARAAELVEQVLVDHRSS